MNQSPPADRPVSVIEQFRLAARSPAALIVGALLGGFVPIMTWHFLHAELDRGAELLGQAPLYIALGGLAFSAKSVFVWCSQAFRDVAKAAGFVVLAEGVMGLAEEPWASLTALALLTTINAVATGARLALEDGAGRRKPRAERASRRKPKLRAVAGGKAAP